MQNRTVVIAVIGIIVVGVWAYLWFGTATIAVTSEPSGAAVRVDGRQRGVTPIARLELDAGSHRVEVIHSHFATAVENLRLSRGDHVERHVVLKPGTGTFEFLSNPKGAWVEVDGERLDGVTPVIYETASGPREIAMGQQERFIVQETHTLNDGETLEVNFNLNIDPHGSVTISTLPRDALVEFLGEDIEYAPKVRMQIGEYAVRVSRSGYYPEEFRYKVRYGDNLHHVELQRAYGRLIVSVQPRDAAVDVAYAEGGRTVRKAYAEGMRVPVGRVEVRARSLGRRTVFKTLQLSSGGASVNFELQRMSVTPGSEIVDKLRDGTDGPVMIVVPAGSFEMGDDNGPPSERPAHTVTLTQPFAVSRTEVTIADYRKFAAASGKQVDERLRSAEPDAPIAFVGHGDAVAYAGWLSQQTRERYRLPSEAEWEYFAKAGTSTPYFFGSDPLKLCEYGNIADLATRKRYRDWEVTKCQDNRVRPGAVAAYQPNGFGLYDIYGNVAEWVQDCGMPDYDNSPGDGLPLDEGSGCASHGVRGGSWDTSAKEIHASYRNIASKPSDDRGIRLVREL